MGRAARNVGRAAWDVERGMRDVGCGTWENVGCGIFSVLWHDMSLTLRVACSYSRGYRGRNSIFVVVAARCSNECGRFYSAVYIS